MYIALNSVKDLAVSFAIFAELIMCKASKAFKIEFLKRKFKQKAKLNFQFQ